MRMITEHRVNDCNRAITLEAGDTDRTTGGVYEYSVSYEYSVRGAAQESPPVPVRLELEFQRGNPKEVGINGLTNEVLLAILIDRARAFQAGQLASEGNARALGGLLEAREAFMDRTVERLQRGVEGQRTP